MKMELESEENERYLKRAAGMELVSAADLRSAVERSLQPALTALHEEVGKLGVKTGRLRAAVGTKIRTYGGVSEGFAKRFSTPTVLGVVGFISGRAPHDWYVETGTRPRPGTGQMPAFEPAQKAYDRTRDQVTSLMGAEMHALASRAVRKLAG